MPRDIERSIAYNFHLTQSPPPPTPEEIAVHDAIKQLFGNCFDNKNWDSYQSDHLARALFQTFGDGVLCAFLDELEERLANDSIELHTDKHSEALNYIWGECFDHSYKSVSEAELLRVIELLKREDVRDVLGAETLLAFIEDYGKSTIVPHLEKIRDTDVLSLFDELRALENAIGACRDRS